MTEQIKFSEYVKILQKFLKDNPEISDYIAITSKDAEGNGFEPIFYDPSIGYYDEVNKDFDMNNEIDENAVCVN